MDVFPDDAGGGEVHADYTYHESLPLKKLDESVDKLDFGVA